MSESTVIYESLVRPDARRIFGIASSARPSETVLSNGRDQWARERISLLPSGCVVEGGIPLLVAHAGESVRALTASEMNSRRVGKVVRVEVDDKAVRIAAELDDSPEADEAWRGIQSGRLRGLSIAADEMQLVGIEYDEGPRFAVYDRWRLVEVSICQLGANADAQIERIES